MSDIIHGHTRIPKLSSTLSKLAFDVVAGLPDAPQQLQKEILEFVYHTFGNSLIVINTHSGFAKYAKEHLISSKYPVLTDYHDAMSFRDIDFPLHKYHSQLPYPKDSIHVSSGPSERDTFAHGSYVFDVSEEPDTINVLYPFRIATERNLTRTLLDLKDVVRHELMHMMQHLYHMAGVRGGFRNKRHTSEFTIPGSQNDLYTKEHALRSFEILPNISSAVTHIEDWLQKYPQTERKQLLSKVLNGSYKYDGTARGLDPLILSRLIYLRKNHSDIYRYVARKIYQEVRHLL